MKPAMILMEAREKSTVTTKNSQKTVVAQASVLLLFSCFANIVRATNGS
jgi:hypothetical protein